MMMDTKNREGLVTMMNQKTKGDLSKIIEREINLEVPRTASEIKLQSVGAKLIEAFTKLAAEQGDSPQTHIPKPQ